MLHIALFFPACHQVPSCFSQLSSQPVIASTWVAPLVIRLTSEELQTFFRQSYTDYPRETAAMSTMPTLPFVVLQTHKPSSTTDIIAAAAAAAATAGTAAAAVSNAATTGLSSSSVSSLKPPRSPTSPAPASRTGSGSGATGALPSSPGGTRPNSSINHTHSLPGSSSTRARADSVAAAIMSSTIPPPPSSSSSPSLSGPAAAVGAIPSPSSNSSNSSSAPSSLQVRTLHPQVHYIFENDPLETEILESVPKSRSITLDFDPRTGSIRNVESFLTDLQVMEVKLVPFQATLPALSTSSSSTSLNSMMGGIHNSTSTNTVSGESQQQPQQQPQQQHRSTTTPTLGRTNSSGASSIHSSMTTSATKMTRRPSERSLGNHAGTGGEGEDKTQAEVAAGGGAGKDWTLVINAVEVDGKDPDSESEMLEQSMLSSFDTDMGSEDSLVYSDALLKSFQTRSMLVRKVIDYTTSTSSAASASTQQ
ncbi:hypothetical protein KVV02_007642 [Mortierella alpina]|uniref:Uncharacterized protein n=1 Tax=Mortierella alpina TaxID=64518 RepID=A0A9P8A8Z6_MORAP|nr:hypothetical protein KVV02_007642 [Mortierella alpina]